MASIKLLALAALAVALTVGTGGAQTRSGRVFLRYGKPLKPVSLDLETGTITRGPAVKDRGIGTTVDFANNDLGGFLGFDTGGGFCEWIDAAVKGFNGNASDLMNEIVFAYCSSALDPASGTGGPGGSVRLGFYEGYTLGGGAPTTAVAVLSLTGLPANTGSCGWGTNFRCYYISVSFGSLIGFADGPIGYSWRFMDVDPCVYAPLAATLPILSCVASCSGTIGQVDGQGMTDMIDQYCPPGFLRATFSFGTSSGSFTSLSMEIREVSDLAATRADYGSAPPFSGDNWDTLTASTAIVGGTWSPVLTIPGAGHGHGTGGVVTVKVRTTASNGPTITSPLGGRRTEILTSGALLATLNGTHDGSAATLPAQSIPLSLAFVCFHYAAQATVLGGGFADLSLGHEGTTGTF